MGGARFTYSSGKIPRGGAGPPLRGWGKRPVAPLFYFLVFKNINGTRNCRSTRRKANKDAVAKVLVTVHSDLGEH